MLNRTFVMVNKHDAPNFDNISSSNRELARSIEEVSKNNIKAMDRVDISLEEYEKLKLRIEELTSINNRLKSILEVIDFPIEEFLKCKYSEIKDAVTTYYDNISLFSGTRKYRIEFTVSEEALKYFGI